MVFGGANSEAKCGAQPVMGPSGASGKGPIGSTPAKPCRQEGEVRGVPCVRSFFLKPGGVRTGNHPPRVQGAPPPGGGGRPESKNMGRKNGSGKSPYVTNRILIKVVVLTGVNS